MEHVTAAIASLPKQLPHVEPCPQTKVQWYSALDVVMQGNYTIHNGVIFFNFCSGLSHMCYCHTMLHYLLICIQLSTHYAQSGCSVWFQVHLLILALITASASLLRMMTTTTPDCAETHTRHQPL